MANLAQDFNAMADQQSQFGGIDVDGVSARHSVSSRPVDLVHLARQSLGDRSLELEILGLFASQSELYMSRLANAKTAEERKMAAHTILGSARGIGAWDVAKEAQAIELDGKVKSDLAGLRRAVDAANNYIQSIL